MRGIVPISMLCCLISGAAWAIDDEATDERAKDLSELQASLDAYNTGRKLDKYEKRPVFAHVVLDSLKFTAEGAYTNSDNLLTGPGTATNVPREFDSEKTVWGVDVGWVDRKVIRDIALDFGGRDARKSYLEKSGTYGTWLRWGLLDAVTIKALVGYGSTMNDAEGSENSKTSNEFLYTFAIKYTVPFDGAWKNPLD